LEEGAFYHTYNRRLDNQQFTAPDSLTLGPASDFQFLLYWLRIITNIAWLLIKMLHQTS